MKKEKIEFKIEHMDSLGQGVSKSNNKITFISNALPKEEGIAYIHKQKKGVQFAQLKSIDDLTLFSKNRITPECSHFGLCTSCQYLHTDYATELSSKENNLTRMIKHPVIVHPAKQRFNYRNRIQLHYDLIKEKIGFISNINYEIIPILNCVIPDQKIQKEIINLYKSDNWINLVKKNTKYNKGHIELYKKNDGKIKISFNDNYAAGGFSQVNTEMNIDLINYIFQFYKDKNINNIIDLFGGSGNLTAKFNKSKITVIDSVKPKTPLKSNQSFISLNLYKKNILKELKNITNNKEIDLLIIDPPRSGHKKLKEILLQTMPKYFLYVSCDPSTLTRDASEIHKTFQVEEAHLFDFFPGTYHFETALMFKNNTVQ